MESSLLKGKIVLVTGGAGLIGSSLVETIVKQEGTGIVVDFDEEKGKKLCTQIKKIHPSCKLDFYRLDITDKSSILKMIEDIVEKFGKIDALVNCAYPRNKNFGRSFFEVEYKDLCDNIDLHLGGFFLMCQQLGAYFLEKGEGNIINFASIYGVIPPRFEIYEGTAMTNAVEYGMIKSSLIYLMKYMAKLFKGKNIRINTISPGGILDGQPTSFLNRYQEFCLSKGMLDPKDLHGTLIYLLSDMSKFVNGQNLIVDDGFTL